MISIIEEISNIKSGRKELRKFGLVIGAILTVLSGIMLWRGKGPFAFFLICGISLISLGLARPTLLKPLQKVWMAFSVVLGFFTSRAVITILFYVIVTPIGLLMKLFGRDILDERISKDRPSYWQERPILKKAKESYGRQY